MARGSIIGRNGRYGYRIDLGADPSTGKRRQSSKQGFRTQREAERARDAQVASLETGTVGGRSALTPMQIENFYSDLAVAGTHSKRPLSAKTIRNTHTVLRKALSDAERLGLVNRNAAASVKPSVPQHVAHRTWSVHEVRQFLAHAEHDRLVATYVLLVRTGMRRGEALGLRWRDLDLDASEAAMLQTLTTVGNRTVISTPKTARSRRVVYLDESTVHALRSHRSRQNRKRLAKSAGLPSIRLHGLRHTYATLALKGGIHPKIVSERRGRAVVRPIGRLVRASEAQIRCSA